VAPRTRGALLTHDITVGDGGPSRSREGARHRDLLGRRGAALTVLDSTRCACTPVARQPGKGCHLRTREPAGTPAVSRAIMTPRPALMLAVPHFASLMGQIVSRRARQASGPTNNNGNRAPDLPTIAREVGPANVTPWVSKRLNKDP
jgi:hypothetical protein